MKTHQALQLHMALIIVSFCFDSINGVNGADVRHQQAFDARLNHLAVDNISGRVSEAKMRQQISKKNIIKVCVKFA